MPGKKDGHRSLFALLWPTSGFQIVNWEYEQLRPAVAYGAQQELNLVVWEDHHNTYGDDAEIYGQVVNPNGPLIGDRIPISWEGDLQRFNPSLAYNSGTDRFLVVWELATTYDNHDIYGRWVSGDGASLGNEFPIAATPQNETRPAVAYHPFYGIYLVVWERLNSDIPAQTDLYGLLVQDDGVLESSPILIANGSSSEALPAVAYGDANQLFLVAFQLEQPDSTWDIIGQLVGGDGSLLGGAIPINVDDANQVKPSLDYNIASSEFLVVWEHSFPGVDDRSDIYARRLAGDGELLGSSFSIAGSGGQFMYNPAAVYYPAIQSIMVVWDHAASEIDHNIYYRRVAKNGTMPDAAVAFTALPTKEESPAIAPGYSQTVLIVWEDDRNSGATSFDIYGDYALFQLPYFTGSVSLGNPGDSLHGIQDITVQLYCSDIAGVHGTLMDTATTDVEGWYRLTAYYACGFYNIIETDWVGHISTGAESSFGSVIDNNWIQFAHPLDSNQLYGNIFWDNWNDSSSPGSWSGFTPSSWIADISPDCTIQVQDLGSGLDVSTAQYQYSSNLEYTWSGWLPATSTGSDGTTIFQTITAANVPFVKNEVQSRVYRIRFRIADLAGNLGESQSYEPLIDVYRPLIIGYLNCLPGATFWSNQNNAFCSWQASQDSESGLAGYAILWDHAAGTRPSSIVNTISLNTSQTLADSSDWFFHILPVDQVGNGAVVASHYGPIKIDTTLPSSTASSPATTASPSFSVNLSGTDAGSGIAGYHLQYRDLTLGTDWKDVVVFSPSTSHVFNGKHGHRYQFRVRAKDNAGNIEGWPAGYDSETSVTTVDFNAYGLEVTQGVQDMNNSVLLVENKRTFVRFYVKSLTNGDQGPVDAFLQVWRGSSYLGALQPKNKGNLITVKKTPSRANLDDSFLFEIPSYWLNGTLTLRATVDPDHDWAETNVGNNAYEVARGFNTSPEMNLVIVDACYEGGGTTYRIRNEDYWALESWLLRAFPIHRLNVQWATVSPCFSSRPTSGDVNKVLSWARAANIKGGTERPQQRYYGMAINTGGFMRGSGQMPGFVASGPTGAPGANSWDKDTSWGDWYGGHELGHNYNQEHTRGIDPSPCGDCKDPKCDGSCGCEGGAVIHYADGEISPNLNYDALNAVFGFDILTRQIYTPWWKDLMTYCGNLWVSDYLYENIYNRMVSESQTTPDLQAPVETQEHLVVFGSLISETQQVTLDAFYRMPDTWDIFEREPGDYSIRLLDSGGAILADYPFTPHLDHVDAIGSCDAGVNLGEQNEPFEQIITEFVPWVEGTARIAIVHGGQVLAQRQVSPTAPQVNLTFPNGGENLIVESFTVTWGATDLDGDMLEFSLEYSSDGGNTWQMLASAITATQVTLDSTFVPGSDQGLFRVLATDGVNTSWDDSDDVFTILGKAPTVSLFSPMDGELYGPGEMIAFQANAFDMEDDSLDDSLFSWSSDLDGFLGVGRLLHRDDLSMGKHIITLTVTDSSDNQTTHAVTIYVMRMDYQIYLPLAGR